MHCAIRYIMKTTLIAFLILAACGPQQKRFEVSKDALPADVESLRFAALGINTVMGCEQVVLGTAEQTFNPSDEGKGYNFISFTNNVKTNEELNGGSNAARELYGETSILPGDTDIFLTSFTVTPYSSACVMEGDTCVRKYDVNPIMAELIAVHEMGHALGLGHSKNPDDIMYSYVGDNIHENGLSPEQWARYGDQLKAAGIVCPQGGYGVPASNAF